MEKPLDPRLRPTKALIHDAVDATTYLISEGHESTARLVVGALSLVPSLRTPARAADGARRLITGGVLGSVRAVNRLVEVVSDVALDVSPLEAGPEPAVPMRSDALVSPVGAIDQLVGVVNGVVGDHLADVGNGLDLGMRLRHDDRWLQLGESDGTVDAPGAGRRLVVLVHGLATTELSWSLDAEAALGDAGLNYGVMLQEELGLTPLFLRYNTGLTVEENGQRFAALLEALVAAWPEPVEELLLVGHSMGGLVIRAATHAGRAAGHRWVEQLSHIACLGSPHAGAPLARFGQVAADTLQWIEHPASRVIGRILSHRSDGVKDLRQRDLEAVGPLLSGVSYLFVAGALTDPDHPAASVLGDLLVPVESASGPDGSNVTVRRFGGIAHHRLQAHPEVYRALADALLAPARIILPGHVPRLLV